MACPPSPRPGTNTRDHRRLTVPPQKPNHQARGLSCVDLRRFLCGQDNSAHISGKRPSEGVARARLQLQACQTKIMDEEFPEYK
jgi:hypothetical protein